MSLLLEYSINHFDDLNILKEGFGARTEKRESISTDSSSIQQFDESSDHSDDASSSDPESSAKLSETVVDLKEQMHSDIEKENQLELEKLFFGSNESRVSETLSWGSLPRDQSWGMFRIYLGRQGLFGWQQPLADQER